MKKNPDGYKPPNLLFQYRQKSLYSQKDLADLLGSDRQVISAWERSRSGPNLWNAIGLSVAFHCLVDEIFISYRQEWTKIVEKNRTLLSRRKRPYHPYKRAYIKKRRAGSKSSGVSKKVFTRTKKKHHNRAA